MRRRARERGCVTARAIRDVAMAMEARMRPWRRCLTVLVSVRISCAKGGAGEGWGSATVAAKRGVCSQIYACQGWARASIRTLLSSISEAASMYMLHAHKRVSQ